MSSPDPGKEAVEGDISRLRAEYARRDSRQGQGDLYSLFNPAQLFALHNRQRAINHLLHRQGYSATRDWRVLEIGCGAGQVLYEFLAYVARPEQLHGVDLVGERVQSARRLFPTASLAVADGQKLPYPHAAFDVVVQSMAFSSILDDAIKQNISNEMRRVLRPGGCIVWYDFWINPTNPQTKGIRPAEIQQLFRGCRVAYRRVTLAPPIARRLVPASWFLAMLLENLRILNSHYVALITEE
jgi:ubiquinone/menaquinone biosynthesis C-methylase UbiE